MSAPAIQPKQQLVLPRGLIFLAALWFAGSLVLATGLRTPVHPTPASLEPGIRLMLQLISTGLVVGWPLLRLSQPATALPARQTLLDLLSLATLLQIIVWVPRVFTVWTVSRTAAIDLMLLSWTALVGAIVASAIHGGSAQQQDRPIVRTLTMAACVAIVLVGPVLMWLGPPSANVRNNLVALGPFMGISRLAEGGATPATPMQWQQIGVIASAAGLCWLLVGITAAARMWRSRSG